jgi:hypothetical protein
VNKIFIAIVLIFIVFFLVFLVWSKKKEIPFQEIVALDKGITIINARNWYINDLAIIVMTNTGGKTREYAYNSNGVCFIDGLVNDTEYTIEIQRTDIKGMLLYKKKKIKVSPKQTPSRYIILVGASVSSDWHFDQLQKRVTLPDNVVFGNRVQYEFDKKEIIDNIIALPILVDGVIIKECSAYFPREINQSIKQLEGWVGQLRGEKIKPYLATVVPVTKKHDLRYPGKLASILSFNDAVRKFAAENDLIVVDLEEYLRINENDRHLKDDYAQEDGAHLVENAYKHLDNIIPQIIGANARGN